MKKLIKPLCQSCFGGLCSLVFLFFFFTLLRGMILTDRLILQIIAVVLLACFGLACITGAVLLVRGAVDRSTKSASSARAPEPPAT